MQQLKATSTFLEDNKIQKYLERVILKHSGIKMVQVGVSFQMPFKKKRKEENKPSVKTMYAKF